MQLDPGSPLISFGLARLYFDLGDDRKLFEGIANAANRWPDDALIQLPLAFVSLIRLDAAGAVRHAQRAVDGNPQDDPWLLAILRNADLQSARL